MIVNGCFERSDVFDVDAEQLGYLGGLKVGVKDSGDGLGLLGVDLPLDPPPVRLGLGAPGGGAGEVTGR